MTTYTVTERSRYATDGFGFGFPHERAEREFTTEAQAQAYASRRAQSADRRALAANEFLMEAQFVVYRDGEPIDEWTIQPVRAEDEGPTA